MEFAAVGDTISAHELMLSGRVWEVDQGTRCIIVDPGFLTHEVRILDGPHAEKLAFVPADFVHSVDATDTGDPLLDRLSEAPEENLKQLYKTAQKFDDRMDEVRAETEDTSFAEILREYKLTSERKFEIYERKISYPVNSKEYADYYQQEADLAWRQTHLQGRMGEIIHKSDPDRTKTKEGIILQQTYDIEDEMIERETEIDHELYPHLPKPDREREWSIAEHKRLRRELDTVISEYLEGEQQTLNWDELEQERLRELESRRMAPETLETAAEWAAFQWDVANEKAKWRTWTSRNGKHTSEAKLVKHADDRVTLENRAGKQTNVPVEKLSQSDRDYIEQWRKEHE